MSVYGVTQTPHVKAPALQSTIWLLRPTASNPHRYLTVHHVTLLTARLLPGLVDYLRVVFAKEVEDGTTYPQEGEIGPETFETYFFAGDVFVGIIGGQGQTDLEKREADFGINDAREGRDWEECVAGYYYVKPNYPGRSSHICNAGFVVPPNRRGGGCGLALAKSFVHYAPKLGYEASVFNLVFVDNIPSIKLWEKLNFQKAGLIPRAGRLRRKDGQGEAYVDAWVFYKNFADDGVNVGAAQSNAVYLNQ